MPVYARIKLKVFTGYTSQIGQQIQQAISDYINSLMIGDSVLLSRIYSPANLGVVSGGNARYYDIQELTIGKSPGLCRHQTLISDTTNLRPVHRKISL